MSSHRPLHHSSQQRKFAVDRLDERLLMSANSQLFIGPTTPNVMPLVNAALAAAAKTKPTVKLADLPTNLVAGQSVTLTATVTDSRGAKPTGTVTFFDGPKLLGQGTLVDGKAQWKTIGLTGGTHQLKAIYGGDAKHIAAASSVLATLVDRNASNISLTVPKVNLVAGQALGVTVKVTAAAPGSGIPQGGVEILSKGVIVGRGALKNGTAVVTVRLAAGTHNLTARILGDETFKPQTALQTVVVKVGKATTETTVALTEGHGIDSDTYSGTFTARVKPTGGGAGNPSGNVIFREGAKILATVALVGGLISWTIPDLDVGSHTITATYQGSGSFGDSAGSFTKVVVAGSSYAYQGGVSIDYAGGFQGGMTVTGGNVFNGSTTISGGTLQLGNASSGGSLVLGGGSLNFDLGSTVSLTSAIVNPNYYNSTLTLGTITGFGSGTYHLISGYTGALSTTALLTLNPSQPTLTIGTVVPSEPLPVEPVPVDPLPADPLSVFVP